MSRENWLAADKDRWGKVASGWRRDTIATILLRTDDHHPKLIKRADSLCLPLTYPLASYSLPILHLLLPPWNCPATSSVVLYLSESLHIHLPFQLPLLLSKAHTSW